MFNYSADVDCAYVNLAKPISTTVCEELSENIILEYDATNTLVGIELLFLRQLSLLDLESTRQFLSECSYRNLLKKIIEVKNAHN